MKFYMSKRLSVLTLFICIISILISFKPSREIPAKPALKTIVIDAGHGLPNSNARGIYSYESALTLAMALKIGERLKEVLPDCNIIYTRTDENLPNGLKDVKEANRYRAEFANQNHGDLFISIHVNSMEDRYQRKIEGYREENYTVTVGKGKKKKRIRKTRSVPIYHSYKLPCNRTGTETYIWAVNKYDQKQQSVQGRNDDEHFSENDSSGNFAESPDAKILASLRTKKYFDQSLTIATLVEEEFKKIGRNSYGVKQRNSQGIWVLQATNMPSILVETGFICNPEEEDYLNSEKGQNELSYAVMRAVLRYKQLFETGSEAALKAVIDSSAAM
jgi:N-acetylmuramoyl-L-alanine amidase